MTPSRRSLQALIEGCGLELTPAQYDQLWAYHRLFREANAELNLTRIHNFESMVLKHYVDSLLVLMFVEPPSPLLDLGTGPGLPGVPLKIARPDLTMVLAEPRGARAEFLGRVVRELGLAEVEVFAGKVGPRFTSKVAAVITRAVASIPETLARVANCLDPGGSVIFMKGPECDAEVAAAADSNPAQFRFTADHAYAIPGTPHRRRLVVYERLPGEAAPDDATATGSLEAVASHPGPVREVTSDANPTFKLGLDLLTGRGIRKHGQALLAGPRHVAEVLDRFPDRAEAWLTGGQGPPPPSPGLLWVRLSDPLFRQLDVSGTRSPLLLVRVPEMPPWSDDDPWPEGCTLFVPFQDPENVGAVLRSAAAFGAARAVLLRGAAHPFHPKSARAAGPALFQVPLTLGPDLDALESRQAPLIALATDGPEIDAAPWPPRFGLVPGVEGPGLPARFRAGERRRIPIAAGVESLNAATATAVALYAWSRGRFGGPLPPATE